MTLTTTDPGSISVPISGILDALEGVLTPAERAALYDQLVGMRPGAVAPGDLITAELFNRMLGDIDDLSIRLAVLEGAAGGPILDVLSPATTVAINGALKLTGRNFNTEPRNNIVKIGDVEITQFRADSTATDLIFAVPDMFVGLPAQFPVRVLTGNRTSNAMSIAITQQEKIQKGNFILHNTASPAGAIAVGATLSFTWTVQAVTVWDDNVALALLVGQVQGNAVTAANWLSTVKIAPAPPMPILAGNTKSVTVTVKVPTGAVSAQLALQVVSADGHVTNASDPVTVTVGAPVEVSDPRTDLTFNIPALGGGGMTAGPVDIGGLSSPGVLVKIGGTGKLVFDATDKRPAGANPAIDYKFSAEFVGAAGGLVVGAPAPASVSAVPSGDSRSFNLPLTTQAGAAAGSTARLKVVCTQTKTGGGLGSYTSFRIIPLKIVS